MSPVGLGFWALAIWGRLLEASVAGEIGMSGPCLYKRGHLRAPSQATLGVSDLACIREAI